MRPHSDPQGQMTLFQRNHTPENSTIESLDDVAERVTQLLYLKVQDYCALPVERFSESVAQTLKNMVATIKMMTDDLHRMSKRSKLLTVNEILAYILQQEQAGHISESARIQLYEILSGYSDEVLK